MGGEDAGEAVAAVWAALPGTRLILAFIDGKVSISVRYMFIALVEEELVVDPKPYDYLAVALVEDAVALDHVMFEHSLVHLPVGELYVPLPVLEVPLELPLIVHPLVAQLRKVLKIKRLPQLLGLSVVHSTLPTELVVLPLTLVRCLAILVEQFAESMHLVILPFPLVLASVTEVQRAVPVSSPFSLVPLV